MAVKYREYAIRHILVAPKTAYKRRQSRRKIRRRESEKEGEKRQ